VFANSLNRDPCPDHLKGVYFIKDEQKAWEAWQARAVLALAAPADEITNYVKGIYAYLESVAPTGLAAEAFRLPPSSTRAQAALFHSAAGHEHSECAGLARQDQGNRPADSEPVALAAPAVQAAPEWMLVLDNLLRYVEVNECEHDTTHRGGTIWTICDGCGKKWADDEGGFKPYQTPEVIEQARVLLADHTPPAEGKDAFWFMDDNPKPPAAQSADAVDALTDEQIIAIRNATWEGPAQPWGSALRFARAIEAAISQSAAAAKEAT
jgi:ribosomal protein L37AE/L43A